MTSKITRTEQLSNLNIVTKLQEICVNIIFYLLPNKSIHLPISFKLQLFKCKIHWASQYVNSSKSSNTRSMFMSSRKFKIFLKWLRLSMESSLGVLEGTSIFIESVLDFLYRNIYPIFVKPLTVRLSGGSLSEVLNQFKVYLFLTSAR